VIAEVGSRELGAMKQRRDGLKIQRGRGVIGRNVVGRVRPLRVAGYGEGENGQSNGPTGCDRMSHIRCGVASSL